jgi:hypothetical protein
VQVSGATDDDVAALLLLDDPAVLLAARLLLLLVCELGVTGAVVVGSVEVAPPAAVLLPDVAVLIVSAARTTSRTIDPITISRRRQ